MGKHGYCGVLEKDANIIYTQNWSFSFAVFIYCV